MGSADPADVWVLPELFASGYVFRDREEVRRIAEHQNGPTVRRLQEWASKHGAWVAGGFPELAGDRIFNSAVLAGPDGTQVVYRKIHLFDREKELFDPGDRAFSVSKIELPGGTAKVGLMVCFDWVFPESLRSLACQGAELVLHPSNLVLPHCQDAMKTRCLENRVAVVTANRTGVDDRRGEVGRVREECELLLEFTGCSQVLDARGNILHRASRDESVAAVVELDLSLSRDKKITPRNDLLADRRPSLYTM